MRKSSSAVFHRRVVKFSVISFLCLFALVMLSAFRQEIRSQAQDEAAPPTAFSNTAAINIPAGAPASTSGPASPYPSAINVSNIIGVIDKITVKLNNFGHTFPGDVDILLVGPAGQNVMLMSDAGGGTDVNGLTLTFDDAAANPLPAALVSGTFKPTNIDTSDNFPAPAPTPAAGSVLSVFHRTNPNGVWSLYVVDDAGADVGTIAGGWELNITIANQFENPASINFPSSGSANPYPSSITTASLAGNVVKIQVKLNNFSHTSPDHVDILLVSPSGRSVVLMSDVGGANPVSNVSLTFDDTAPGFLPDNAPLTTGIYKPSDFEPGDAFPAPAPQGAPTGGKLAAFFNDQAVGEWKLYAVDDTGNNTGSISAGWLIIIDSSPTAINIPSVGASEPYPSEIMISGQSGLVSKVTVGVQNFNHVAPDDVDLMLVSPSGRKVVLMSDAGGSIEVGGLNLTFDDAATASLPDNSALTSGSYKPTNFEANDFFPAPAPSGAPSGALLSVLNGSEPNGAWRLFLVDDNGENAGIIAGWTLNIQTSEAAIVIPAVGIADPYPSSIAITGQQGSVTKVVVTLSNFSHTFPDDADLLLVAPNGRRIVLMSDVGGGNEVGGLNLVFDDAAASTVPDNAPLVSGTYKPTDFEPGDVFPAPAPAGVSGTTLQAFYGGAANGIWRLYAADDTGENPGSIAGNWSLNIQSSVSACLFGLSSSVQAFPVAGGAGGFNVLMPAGCPWTAVSNNGFISVSSGSSGEGDGAVGLTVAQNFGPARTGTITVTNGSFSRTFQVQQQSGCPFAVNQSTLGFAAAGGGAGVQVTAGAGCAWQATANVTWIFVTSAQQSGDGTVSFVVQPNPGAASRSGSLTIGSLSVTINQAGAKGKRFDFDGDNRADISVFRQGNWYLLQSTSGFAAAQFGIASDKPVPADYDGDRKTDIAVFRQGNWYLLQSSDGAFRAVQFGLSTDQPVPADYNGDGRDELGVYRNGDWYLLDLTGNQTTSVQFGISTDRAVAADYDGDGRADPAVYRGGTWYLLRSSAGFTGVQFGIASDKPVVGDYDGDGKADQAVYRNGNWYINRSSDAQFSAAQFGIATDIPAAADYDGDGKTDLAVFRDGIWYQLNTQTGFTATQFGLANDLPVPSAFLP